MRAIFVPTEKEGEKIFGSVFKPYKYGIRKGEYNGIPLYVTGISKTLTAFSAAIVLSGENVTEAVLTGICGAYRYSGLKVGDVVSIHRDFFADEAVFFNDRVEPVSAMGFGMPSDGCFSPYDTGIMPIVNSNTVSFLDGEGRISDIMGRSTGASVENMEGASFGYACNMLGIKAFHIRAVSNYCGRRDEQMWDINKAFTNLKSFFETHFQF